MTYRHFSQVQPSFGQSATVFWVKWTVQLGQKWRAVDQKSPVYTQKEGSNNFPLFVHYKLNILYDYTYKNTTFNNESQAFR